MVWRGTVVVTTILQTFLSTTTPLQAFFTVTPTVYHLCPPAPKKKEILLVHKALYPQFKNAPCENAAKKKYLLLLKTTLLSSETSGWPPWFSGNWFSLKTTLLLLLLLLVLPFWKGFPSKYDWGPQVCQPQAAVVFICVRNTRLQHFCDVPRCLQYASNFHVHEGNSFWDSRGVGTEWPDRRSVKVAYFYVGTELQTNEHFPVT